MKNEKAVLLHFHDHGFHSAINTCNLFIDSHLQPLSNLYQRAGLGKLQSSDLKPLVEDPKQFLVNMITGGKPLEFMGVKLSKVKANELVHFSEEQEYVIEAAKAVTIAIKSNSLHSVARDLDIFEVSGQKVKITEKALTNLRELYSTYTETESEIYLFNKLNAIKDIMNEIQNKTKVYIDLDNFSDKAFNQLKAGSPMEVNWQFVKQ